MGGERGDVLARLRDEIARRGAGWSGPAAARAPAYAPARIVQDARELAGALGGWPSGALVGVWGPGRTHLAMAAAGGGGPVAWIDLDGTFFPPAAARLGLPLDR